VFDSEVYILQHLCIEVKLRSMPFSLRGVNNQGLLKILLQFSTWAVHEKATLHCNYHISTLLSSPMQCIHFLKLI